MNVQLIESKCSLRPDVRAYAEKKVNKLDRYFKGDTQASVTFRVEKKLCRVELTLRSGSTYFRAEESTTDMMASVDAAVSSIERQIRKNKTRLAKRLRTDAFERTVEPEEAAAAAEPEEQEFQVVRSKKFPIKPMSTEEAILQMNLLGHSFFAFKNEENGGSFAVVYVRQDGGYGIIEDEA